jgi:hypothetical protein
VAPEDERVLTITQAYEAAYRFVWQYAEREPESESLALMLVAMQPTSDRAHTNDPASWEDWLRCVQQTLDGAPLPRFSATDGPGVLG